MPTYTNHSSNRKVTYNPEMFFGHTDLLKSVLEIISQRQCVSIVGPCGIGKSFFLWYVSLPEIQSKFSFDLSHHLFIFLDMEEFLQKNREDFFHDLSISIIHEGQKLGLTFRLNSHSREGVEDKFSSILDRLEDQGYFPVLLLDGFDMVTLNEHFDLAFFEFLRALASWRQVSYVTATTAPLPEVCHSGITGSPFFNIFYSYQLKALLLEEAKMLIAALVQQSNMVCSGEEVALILRLAGRHPFFIHRTCSLLCEQKQKIGKVDESKLKAQVDEDLTPVFKEIWSKLSKERQLQLQYGVQCELSELMESCLFRRFVRESCRSHGLDTKTKELEEILEKIGSRKVTSRELGETRLQFMNAVSQSFKQDTLPSHTEIGKVIQETLIEALNSLQGAGEQADTSAEWTNYNILYYNYFNKQRLKKEQIAERLGMSMQQYSSERKKAINEFRKALSEIEKASISDECESSLFI